MKTCTRCQVTKELSEFHKKPRAACVACTRSLNNARFNQQCPDKRATHRLSSRKNALKKHGLTLESYEAMWSAQGESCKICSKPLKLVSENRNSTACVDHCHRTGAVRGLLCFECNTGLGKFDDNIERLQKAINYLEGANANI